jgi:hypothetical protein
MQVVLRLKVWFAPVGGGTRQLVSRSVALHNEQGGTSAVRRGAAVFGGQGRRAEPDDEP